jgi:hypothetical protein
MAWIAAIVQGVVGAVQMGISMDQLSKLPSAQTFSPATDLETATSMARRAAQQGMTPQERAAAEQAIGTAQSRTQRAMEQRGLGNLAAAVSQIRTTEALNQLEAQNQAIKRQSLGQYASLAGQMQSIQNQNIQSFNQMLYQQQVALGQSAKAGFSNLTMGIGESIASAVEGQDEVDKAAMGGSPVTKAQMGMVDTTTQSTIPEGFGLDYMQKDGASAIDTGLTTDQAFNRIQNPSMQVGQVPQSAKYEDIFGVGGSYNSGTQIGQQMYQTPQLTSYSYQDAFNFSPESSFTGTDFNFFDTTSTGAMVPGGVDSGTYTFQ